MTLKIISLLGLGVSFLLIAGCNEATDADKILEAQYCLDKALPSTAQLCAAKLAGINSPQAYSIRCSADFVEQGFDDPQRLINAMSYVTGGSTNTPGLLSVLAFTKKPSNSSNASNATNADQTFSFCTSSGQKGLTLIAALAKSATEIAGLANPAASGINFSDPSTFTPTNVQKALTDLALSGTANPVVGSAVQTVYGVTCPSGSQANTDICNQLNSAAATYGVSFTTSTPTQIGNALVNYWKTH